MHTCTRRTTSGALEHWLGRTAAGIATPAEAAAAGWAAPPPPPLPLVPSACLRLPDPDRLALHNELARAAAALERVTADARLPAATAPHDAMALREYFAAGMWAHDRCVRGCVLEGGGREGGPAGMGMSG